jgi:hypothetical protein
MKKETFEAQSKEFGDFYVYYVKKDSSQVTYGICTTELEIPYIKSKMRNGKPPRCVGDEVLMWNWKNDAFLRVSLAKIKKLVPLSKVVQKAS